MTQELKKLAVSFFHYWWNQPGSNTEQGFDTWAETDEGKAMISKLEQRNAELEAEVDRLKKNNDEIIMDSIAQHERIKELEARVKLLNELTAIVERAYEVDDEGNFIHEGDLADIGEKIATKLGYL